MLVHVKEKYGQRGIFSGTSLRFFVAMLEKTGAVALRLAAKQRHHESGSIDTTASSLYLFTSAY